ncbi:MAG: D-inositol-3-phosphate glycosyltransferase [Chloroflexi bacterium]|nr:MAG: D-inositol-3-phosphate glycosyltransferase [Chloroflexota bacterium]
MSHHLQRLAFLSTHSSPLAVPGTTKAGGMNVYITALTRQLGRSGRHVDIFTRRDSPDLPLTVALDRNVRVVNITAGPPSSLTPLQVHAVEPEFRAGVEAFVAQDAPAQDAQADRAPTDGAPYDLIHSHYWISALTGIALADRWRRPHVAMFHTLGEVKNRARRDEREPQLRIDAEREIVARADRLICATPHEKSFLVELYGAHADCVSVVPGGVDLERFSPAQPGAAQPGAAQPGANRAQLRRALGLPSAPTALFVGRLEPLKGVDILIQAAGLADVDPALHVVIVGGDATDTAERARLQGLARAAGVDDRVHFVDAVDRDTLALYYRAADVCVVPSYYESFGLVAVEALACGTPVIATRVGGLQYTIRDGQTGHLISWRCPEPFAERLEALLANDDLRARFGLAAPESVQRFDWNVVAEQIVGVYEDLLIRHATGAASCHAS